MSIYRTSIAKKEKARAHYLQLRLRLLERGHSLRSFALAHGYNPQTVYCAARGTRAGKEATKIRKHLEQFL
jgi:hypothetical protein